MAYQIHVLDVKCLKKTIFGCWKIAQPKEVVVIDPTEANLVKDFCLEHHLTLKQIWLTHWHRDHTDGVSSYYLIKISWSMAHGMN